MRCQGSPFLEYQREDPVPVRRRDSVAYIRSRVNPRNYHQRIGPVLGCIASQGRMVHTCGAAPSACRPESEPFRGRRSSSGSLTGSVRSRRHTACGKTCTLDFCRARCSCRKASARRVFRLIPFRYPEGLADSVLCADGIVSAAVRLATFECLYLRCSRSPAARWLSLVQTCWEKYHAGFVWLL